MQKLLKIGLLSSVSLLLSWICFIASVETSYATSSKSLPEIGLLPGLSVDILSTPTPTPTPTPSPQATSTSTVQVTPAPTNSVLSSPSAKVKPASSESVKTPVKAYPTTVATTGGAAIPVVITIHLSNAESLNVKISKWFFILGICAPLLLISTGVFWLLTKQRKQSA